MQKEGHSHPINTPGMFLSHPGMTTIPSSQWPPAAVSIWSAIRSRDCREYDIPNVPIDIPSDTPTVPNWYGIMAPVDVIDFLTRVPKPSRWPLHLIEYNIYYASIFVENKCLNDLRVALVPYHYSAHGMRRNQAAYQTLPTPTIALLRSESFSTPSVAHSIACISHLRTPILGPNKGLMLTWLAPCAFGWVTVRLYLLIPSGVWVLEE